METLINNIFDQSLVKIKINKQLKEKGNWKSESEVVLFISFYKMNLCANFKELKKVIVKTVEIKNNICDAVELHKNPRYPL